MIKSFSDFILENSNSNFDINVFINDILHMLNKADKRNSDYTTLGKKEYIDPYYVDIQLDARFTDTPDFKTDDHFKNLKWEQFNFDNNGFSIDANLFTDDVDNTIPTIIVTIIIDPSAIKMNELKLRLLDILTHETKHLTQIGWNKQQFKAETSSSDVRNNSKKDFNYFLLPEEMEAMVTGMYTRSKKEGANIDILFDKYLTPFIKNGFISTSEYLKVFKAWITYALQKYPDVKLTMDNKEVSKIVDSI